ncbi:MAG: glycine oxidase ThiO [Litoreibacter sp.]|nr:glycine oxidase ThiO [Litoreibacter sp.]
MTESVTILGGGVAGLCVAAELSGRNVPVTVCDPEPVPGPHACSWWAGGMLAPFCEGETAEEPVVRLGQESGAWWERHGTQVVQNGSLVIVLERDRRELDRFARRTEGHESIDGTRLAALEPDLEGRFDRALYFAQEAHISPREALEGLNEKLRTRGVNFSAEPGNSGGQVIDCRGLSARDRIPDLRGVKGEMLVLRTPDLSLSRPVRLLHPRFPLYIVPRGDGVFMLGATQIESSERRRATVRSVMELLSAAYALHPAFGEAELLEIGVDARPAFPDNLPRIRRHGDTLYVNGLFRHGFLLAPAMARMTADFLLNGTKPEVMDENHG